MKTIIVNVYADPGHAWVKMSIDWLQRKGIDLTGISGCSYHRKDYVYLEEDCDWGYVYKQLLLKGYQVSYRMHHTNNRSRIRNYNSFSLKAYVTS